MRLFPGSVQFEYFQTEVPVRRFRTAYPLPETKAMQVRRILNWPYRQEYSERTALTKQVKQAQSEWS